MTPQQTASPVLSSQEGVTEAPEEPDRPVRNGSLHRILDEEFSRSYRFEGLADFVHDVKHLFRWVVGKDQEGLDDLEQSLPRSES